MNTSLNPFGADYKKPECGTFFNPFPQEFMCGAAPQQLVSQFRNVGFDREWPTEADYVAEGKYPGRGAGLFGRTYGPTLAVAGLTPELVVSIPGEVSAQRRRARYKISTGQ